MSSAAPSADSASRRAGGGIILALAGATVVVAVLLTARTAASGFPIPIDYYQYWSTGLLCLEGENPYDPDRLRQLQESAGMMNGKAVMSWHPPWTLAVALPFGLLPLGTGCLAWVLVQAVAVFASAGLLWRAFGGSDRLRWVGWAVAAGFAPTIYLLGAAQITGLCVLGVAGFVAGMRAGRPGWAGAAAALTAIKPHLLALFGLALLLEATRDRSARRAVLAGVGVLATATLVVVAFNPAVLGQYADTFLDRHATNPYRVTDVPSPTPGWALREAVAPGSFAVSLVPLVVLSAAVAVCWWRTRRSWDWARVVPWLVLGSVLAAPYGGWLYDLVLLVIPVLAVAAKLAAPEVGGAARTVAVGCFAAVSGGVFAAVNLAPTVADIRIGWVAPAVLAGVVLTTAAVRWTRAEGVA